MRGWLDVGRGKNKLLIRLSCYDSIVKIDDLPIFADIFSRSGVDGIRLRIYIPSSWSRDKALDL